MANESLKNAKQLQSVLKDCNNVIKEIARNLREVLEAHKELLVDVRGVGNDAAVKFTEALDLFQRTSTNIMKDGLKDVLLSIAHSTGETLCSVLQKELQPTVESWAALAVTNRNVQLALCKPPCTEVATQTECFKEEKSCQTPLPTKTQKKPTKDKSVQAERKPKTMDSSTSVEIQVEEVSTSTEKKEALDFACQVDPEKTEEIPETSKCPGISSKKIYQPPWRRSRPFVVKGIPKQESLNNIEVSLSAQKLKVSSVQRLRSLKRKKLLKIVFFRTEATDQELATLREVCGHTVKIEPFREVTLPVKRLEESSWKKSEAKKKKHPSIKNEAKKIPLPPLQLWNDFVSRYLADMPNV